MSVPSLDTQFNTYNKQINISNEVSILLKLYKNNKINTYDFNKFKNIDLNILVSFVELVSLSIYTDKGYQEINKNFKLSYFNGLVSLLIDTVISYTYKEKIFQQNVRYFLYILTTIEHGHQHLKQIKNILYIEDDNLKKEILNLSSSKGGFPAFLFWIDFFNLCRDDYREF